MEKGVLTASGCEIGCEIGGNILCLIGNIQGSIQGNIQGEYYFFGEWEEEERGSSNAG